SRQGLASSPGACQNVLWHPRRARRPPCRSTPRRWRPCTSRCSCQLSSCGAWAFAWRYLCEGSGDLKRVMKRVTESWLDNKHRRATEGNTSSTKTYDLKMPLGVFAPLVGALVFKTSGGFE